VTALVLAFVAGLVAGAFSTMALACVWAAGDALVDRALAPGFDSHVDDALENSREREVSS
jgi:hypothetical protein